MKATTLIEAISAVYFEKEQLKERGFYKDKDPQWYIARRNRLRHTMKELKAEYNAITGLNCV